MAKKFQGSWVILIILIILCWPAAIVYFLMKYEEIIPPWQVPLGYPPPAQAPYGYVPPTQVYKEKEIIREIVKIPCKYCGTLVDQNAVRCPSCNAPLK